MTSNLRGQPLVGQKTLFQNAVVYTGANLFGQAALVVSNFLLRRLLAPQLMGIWNMVALVRGYMLDISLGATVGAGRELPILHGRGESSRALLCRSVALFSSVAEGLLLGLGLWGYVYFHRFTLGRDEMWALLATAVVVVGLRIQNAFVPFFQGAGRYVPLSRALLVNSIAGAIALPLGAFFGGIPGLLLAAVADEIFETGWIWWCGHSAGVSIKASWDSRLWKSLVSYGVSFKITDYPNTVFMMMGNLWVAHFIGLKALGLYALAQSLAMQSADITVRIGTVLYTRTLTQFGQGVDRKKIGDDMLRFIRIQLLVLVPAVSCAVAVVAPVLIRGVIPLYSESADVLMVLLAGSFFISQNNNLFAMWIAEKRMRAYGLSNLSGVIGVSACLTVLWFFLSKRSLTDVAFGVVLGYAVYFSYMIFTAGRELWGWWTATRTFLEVLAAAAWTCTVLFHTSQGGRGAAGASVLFCAAKAAATMAIGISPLLLFGLWTSDAVLYLKRQTANWGARVVRSEAM